MRTCPSRVAQIGVVLAAAAALTLAGCDDPGAAPGGEVVVAGTPSATSSTGSGSLLPDVCGLLSKAEVTALTGGLEILQVDPDGAAPDATVRHCQWQASGARLAIQLSPTTEADFGGDHPNFEPVAGLGDAAHFFSDHLFVRKGSIQVDVYASTAAGGETDRLLATAAATQVLTRL